VANLFLQLPALAQDGPGTPVDVSALASLKTVIVAGSWRLTPNITIEINLDPAMAGGWAALETFQGAAMQTFGVIAYWMRARVSNFKGGQAPEVWVGAANELALFGTPAVPAGNGAGAAIDVSAMGPYKTVQVAGGFQGQINIEASADGGTTWGTAFSFGAGQAGYQSQLVVADFLRVKRVGVPTLAPGLPIVNVGAGNSPGGGGGGGGDQMTFLYVADGTEGDTFVIPLPSARTSTNYAAWVTGGGLDALLVFDVPVAQYTLNSIQVIASAPLVIGDVLIVNVKDLT
jgi:hypothetical protein